MALADLDRFLLMRETDPGLHQRLAQYAAWIGLESLIKLLKLH